MSNTWFIADTHFGHKNILDFEDRPFDSIEEMEEKMVGAWNNVVQNKDLVYLLGDFCFSSNKEWNRILSRLKGRIILVKGNHDSLKTIRRVFKEGHIDGYHEVGAIINHNNLVFHLTHYPLELGDRPNSFNISGHIHSSLNGQACQINVGVDSEFMREYYKRETDSNGLPLSFGSPVPIEYIFKYAQDVNELLKKQYVRGK